MISVIILGNGNVAGHLIKAFKQAQGVDLKQVYARNAAGLTSLPEQVASCSDLNELLEADIYIIAISDDAIEKFSSKLELKDKLVVHTSGTLPLNSLKSKSQKGVFYPLQTFSAGKPIDFKKVPICIEASNEMALNKLRRLALTISSEVYPIDSEQRKYMHIAAVFANNFVNHLYKISLDICNEQKIPFKILYPLILETAKKATLVGPNRSQTGPAYRSDFKTIKTELELLEGDQKKIYNLLTQAIQKNYGKKL